MKPSLVYLFLHAFVTTFLQYCSMHLCISAAGTVNDNDTDRLALLDIKARITDDPLGVVASWNDTTTLHFCHWDGVTCGHTHQRVTALYLSSSKLTGTLSPYLGNLSFLKELFLDNNSFSGIIPAEIGRLHRLQTLSLNNNSIVGVIPPNISSCSSLIRFGVRGNKLVGEIPYELGSLSNLQNILLMKNNFTGNIPSSLGNLSSLVYLQLGYNNLVGSIPHSLGQLINLKSLILFDNKLSGEIPPSIFNLSYLETLALGVNHLEGKISSNFNSKLMSNLQFLSLSLNRFTGSIPPIMSNFSNLETMDLGGNNLQGQVPSLNNLHKLTRFSIGSNLLGNRHSADLNFISSLANATSMLEFLELQINNFGGSIPSTICNFSTLMYINMGMNKLVGQIPTCIDNLAQLQVFVLLGNHLIGAIPPNIGKLHNLYTLDLSRNQLSRNIPLSIGNLTNLGHLVMYENNLQGQIPFSLGHCKNIQVMDISQNNLRGSIPPEILNLSSLSSRLNLSNNHLTGSLPSEVGQLKNLANLDISNNLLSGEIPSTLGACIELEFLYMGQNHFQGAIPLTLATLKGLNELDLSVNNLSGNIPKYLAGFKLLRLNLSYNNFEGEVPTGGVFNNASGISLYGNSRLCGGISELNLPKCNLNKTPKRKLHQKMRLVIVVVSGFLGVVLLVAFISLYAFCNRKRSKEPTNELENPSLKFSYQSLVRATNGFSSENVLGSGTFGVVYKGILDQDQKVVAIKRFKLEHRDATKSFMAECGALRNIRHRNLVKVITTCSSVDYEGNDFKALIYEYMANGSLEDWLHPYPINSSDRENHAPRNLNVHQRLSIAVDVAFALEYLHHGCGSPIVHCDLKPSNVLLDDEMVAHVGDFGLAKFLSKVIASSHESSSIGVRGTVGYTPPEYGIGNEVSTHGDVYSFGILVLEMFTGKRPTDVVFKEGLSLHKFVKAALPEQATKILDHTLLNDLIDDHETETSYAYKSSTTAANSNKILEAVISVLGIALVCSAALPQERLDMTNVAAKLSSIRNKLLGTRSRPPRRNLPGMQL